jgi:heptosyltransferase-2
MVPFYLALGGTPIAEEDAPHPVLRLPDGAITAALAQVALERDRYWVFAPGAEFGPAKRWPPAHFAALARSLHQRSGLPVMLMGSG